MIIVCFYFSGVWKFSFNVIIIDLTFFFELILCSGNDIGYFFIILGD